MTAVTLRNHRGESVQVPEFSATEAKNSFGRVLDTASSRGMVAICKRDRPTAILLSIDAYEALVDARAPRLDALTQQFDSLLVSMQTSTMRSGMRSAFDADTDELGLAAVNEAATTGTIKPITNIPNAQP
jgi:prevent-host-death family protein